jgi:hypothetical protein
MSHIETIEGQRTLVVPNAPPLPQKLQVLLTTMKVHKMNRIVPSGASSLCKARSHPFVKFVQGSHRGLDGVQRDLLLEMCPHCGAVCVRDISFDGMPELPTGGHAPKRRDHIIGWYSGSRPNGREYS